MKHLVLIATFAITGILASAAQTVEEKAAAGANDIKRAAKRGAHRTQEVFCAKGDAKCLAKKGKHRMKEGLESTKDAAKKAGDSIDTNSTTNQ